MDTLDRQRDIARRRCVREFSVVSLSGRKGEFSVDAVYVFEKGLPYMVQVVELDLHGAAFGRPFTVGLGEVERVIEF
jgi:hypothetical protein